MSQVWAILVGASILLIIYGIINSKISESKRIKAKELSRQRTEDKILPGVKYDFHLRDGKTLAGMVFVGPRGESESDNRADWEGMIAMRNESGKKVFVKRSFIRQVEEN